jgi:cyanophycinase
MAAGALLGELERQNRHRPRDDTLSARDRVVVRRRTTGRGAKQLPGITPVVGGGIVRTGGIAVHRRVAMRSSRRRSLAAVLAVLALVATALPAAANGTPQGHLVLIGGNLRENAEILQEIVDLADPDGAGPNVPRIAIVTAGAAPAKNWGQGKNPKNNNAQANGIYYAELFAQYGATAYPVPIDVSVDFNKDPYVPENADSPAVAAEVRNTDAVFFGGGDQMRYVRTLFECDPADDEAFEDCEDTLVMDAIRDVADDGGVIAGLSAGTTIQQGPDMVTGGESYQGWRDGPEAGYFDDATKLAYLPYGGFGFFAEGLLDSHFTTWGRQARMIRLADDVDVTRAVGVDETTALVVDRATRTGYVIGNHGASILDLAGATVDGENAAGVRWTYLTAGDAINFGTGAVTRATGSAPLAGAGPGPAEIEDAWDSIDGPGNVYSLRDLARALVASGATSATGVTYETSPQYRTTLSKVGTTAAWTTSAGVSFQDLEIAIDPVP